MNDLQADVAIVGGGISGMIAAVRAAEGGKRVIVFEKSTEDRYICNSRLAAGIWHCGLTDIKNPPQQLEARIMEITGGTARPELARAVAADGIRVVRWMQTVGIRFIRGPYDYQSFMLSPPTITPQGRQWQGRGGDVMLNTFEQALGRHQGRLMRGHKAVSLLSERGRIKGVALEAPGGTKLNCIAGAVVLADGGFQCNADYIRGAITPEPGAMFQRNGRTGYGDGLRMAREAGGVATTLDGFYGHVLSVDAFTNDKLWPYRWLDFVLAGGMGVTRDGRRFADEGQGGVYMANAMARLAQPSGSFVIADRTIWAERGTFNLMPPNPAFMEAGGKVFIAGSLAELAAQSGIDGAGLAAEVQRYNAAVDAGKTGELDPARSTAKYQAYPIRQAPFYAFPVCPGITYTMGGISIDADCRVLDANGQAIAGLYAAGCATGGLEGGPKTGYVGGLVKSSVTGLRAAEHILQAA